MDAQDPEDYACHCLVARSMARTVSRIYDRHLAPSGITATELAILKFIQSAGLITVNELCAKMFMERTTLVRMLKPLRGKGDVEASADPKLSRRGLLSVTETGGAKIRAAHDLWLAAQAEWEAVQGVEQAKKVRGAMLHSIGAG